MPGGFVDLGKVKFLEDSLGEGGDMPRGGAAACQQAQADTPTHTHKHAWGLCESGGVWVNF